MLFIILHKNRRIVEKSNLGKKITELRKAKGLTQQELAEQCRINTRTLQRIENGNVTPRAYTVRSIFSALGCDFLEKDTPLMMLHFERVCNYLKDLFNLKINTMKKVSILSVFTLAIGFGLFLLCFDSKAQKIGKESYLPSRGIVYQIPRNSGDIFISNTKDTVLHRFGKYHIQEYNGKVFLDGEFIEFVEEGDTVILNRGTLFNNAKLEFRRMKYQTILAQNGITFLSPKHLPFTLSIKIGNNGEAHWKSKNNDFFVKDNKIILNEDNQLFLNGVYQGNVISNDTIIIKSRGTLTIKNASKI